MPRSLEHPEQPAEEREFLRDTKWVSVNDAELGYVERGNGPPVVFVHGGPNDLTAWMSLLPLVAERYHTIAYSRRYSWPNQPIPHDVDDQLLPHAEDLLVLIQALQLGPVHLVGSSWGGFVCLFSALRRPDLVRSLVLQEPPVLPLLVGAPPRPGNLLRLLATRPATGWAVLSLTFGAIVPSTNAFKRGQTKEGVDIFMRNAVFGPAYDALPEEFKRHLMLSADTLRAQSLGKGFPSFTADEARSIETPTLLMTGAISPPVFHRLTDRLYELLPKAERIEIPRASHVMHLQNADATATAIVDFLAKHSAR